MIRVVDSACLDDGDLEKDFPIMIWDKTTQTGYTLLHLLTHLNYHLGIN